MVVGVAFHVELIELIELIENDDEIHVVGLWGDKMMSPKIPSKERETYS